MNYSGIPVFLLRVAGGLLVLAAGAIHLWLYFDFFHTVDVVGTLFLINAAGAFAIGAALLVTASGWVVAAGIAYSAGTLGGFFLSVYHGISGYVERLKGPWQEAAGGVELAAIVVLLAVAAATVRRTRPVRANRRLPWPVSEGEPRTLDRGGPST